MTARISMADAKFSFQCPGRMYSPAWMAPEGTINPHHSQSPLLSNHLGAAHLPLYDSDAELCMKPQGVLPALRQTSSQSASIVPALQKKPEDINRRSADMWSFAVLLWELVTREVPFADLSHMEIGMKVS